MKNLNNFAKEWKEGWIIGANIIDPIRRFLLFIYLISGLIVLIS